jgi:hypothetical protein
MSTPNPHPHSCLGSLLHGLTPKATGYDSKSFTEVYPHSQEELKRLQCYASTTRFTLASGLAVIGKLLVIEEAASELNTSDITTLGDLLATFGESLLELSTNMTSEVMEMLSETTDKLSKTTASLERSNAGTETLLAKTRLLLAQHEDLLGLIACIERDETGGTLQ